MTINTSLCPCPSPHQSPQVNLSPSLVRAQVNCRGPQVTQNHSLNPSQSARVSESPCQSQGLWVILIPSQSSRLSPKSMSWSVADPEIKIDSESMSKSILGSMGYPPSVYTVDVFPSLSSVAEHHSPSDLAFILHYPVLALVEDLLLPLPLKSRLLCPRWYMVGRGGGSVRNLPTVVHKPHL